MKDSLMDTREDVRTVEKSFKIVHQLCRQYGMSFDREFERSSRDNPDAQRVRRK
jgi:hypothetical protein